MKGNVSKIVSDKGAASEQYIDATVGTALKNSKEAKEDASAARTIAQETSDAFNLHQHDETIHTTAEEKADVDERIHTAQLTAEDAKDEAQNVYSLLLLVEDEIVKKLDTKADKDTTLDGYGITDAYTKTEIDAQLGDIETALDNIISIQNSLMGVSE